MTGPLLAFDGVSKSFPGIVALKDVSLSLRPGEIRGLMGENGAGKSTLLKILAGEYRPDGGRVLVGGAAVAAGSPRASAEAGVAIIHQELNLVPEMSVEENLLLGALPSRFGFLDRAEMRRRRQAVLERLGEPLDPKARVKRLPIGQRQMIEIGKALLRDARVIAFDEPTSSLSIREISALMQIIRELKARGCAILYVSHRMEEVFELCDSITILRDGEHVATHADARAAPSRMLISQMAGRDIADVYGYRPRPAREVRLAVEGLVGPGLTAPVSFEARRGEVLGFFGLVGAGRSDLFKLLYGARRPRAGRIRLDGAEVRFRSPREAAARGLAFCPEDRADEGVIPRASLSDNVNLALRNLPSGKAPIIDRKREQAVARRQVDALRIKAASLETPIGVLSGGNQQKAILGRWLAADASLFLLDEPTRGIDIAARSEIYALLADLADAGRCLLVASSDLPEVLGIADRVVVMRGGGVAGVLARADATPEAVLALALPGAATPEPTPASPA